jgi:hypothetical protein
MPKIDFATKVNWQNERQILKVSFPVDINTDVATYEIQFGTTKRPTHYNTSWDHAKYEVCGQKYADLSEGDYGVSGAFWIITGPDTQFRDSEGNKITRSSLNANDIIEIEYSGQVMMSYPPQVYAKAITIK